MQASCCCLPVLLYPLMAAACYHQHTLCSVSYCCHNLLPSSTFFRPPLLTIDYCCLLLQLLCKPYCCVLLLLPSNAVTVSCLSLLMLPVSPTSASFSCFCCLLLLPPTAADSFHKPGFKLHARILHHLFSTVNSGVIKAPLWDEAAKGPTAYPNNAVFVHEYVSDLLSRSFPNLRPAQLQVPAVCILHATLISGSLLGIRCLLCLTVLSLFRACFCAQCMCAASQCPVLLTFHFDM